MKLETTAYHLYVNGETERKNNNIVTRMLNYVSENQTEWDTYVQQLTS